MLVGFAGYLEGGDPYQAAESGWAAALGMLLVILAEVVQAAQVGAACLPASCCLLCTGSSQRSYARALLPPNPAVGRV